MLSDYATYYTFIGEYASKNSKIDELAEMKAETIIQSFENENVKPQTVLTLGFGLIPVGLINKGYDVTIGYCGDSCRAFGEELGIVHRMVGKLLPDFVDEGAKFDAVVAGDDFFTYLETEEDQILACEQLTEIANSIIVVTARDYKNLPQHHRQFDEPLAFEYDEGKDVVMFQRRKWSRTDRQTWQNYMYAVSDDGTHILGPMNRRTIYFKQLAKYMHDCGVSDYKIQKNLLYKPLFAKHYEHIITIKP